MTVVIEDVCRKGVSKNEKEMEGSGERDFAYRA
jgi:hypothetical protein